MPLSPRRAPALPPLPPWWGVAIQRPYAQIPAVRPLTQTRRQRDPDRITDTRHRTFINHCTGVRSEVSPMRTQRSYRLVVSVVLLSCLLALLPPAGVAHAGANGQQLVFYRYSNGSYIAWLQVTGTNQRNASATWSRTFTPAVANYSLTGWWWKGLTTVKWRLANGRTGACSFIMPVSQQGDWKQVGVDRQPGNSCYFS